MIDEDCGLEWRAGYGVSSEVGMKKGEDGSRPLNSGNTFAVQVSVSCALSTREQMSLVCRVPYASNPFVRFYVPDLQLLISLRATMMAMTTIRTTRMMSRISVRPIPSEEDPLA